MIPLHSHKAVYGWLLACMSMVALMVFIGGVTRLTESGLSIVEWKLVSGTLPPLSDEAWQQEFGEYKTSPEYQKKNYSFGVAEFKRIFWLEYLHRLLGRLTGLVFFIPLLYFVARKALPARLTRRMLGACVLVGAQGTVGWIMVASGLEHDPRVNPAKLALHLMLALTLFSLLLWTYWQAKARVRLAGNRRFVMLLRVTLVCLVVQIILGALVAGNDAGLTYNTYPLMDGRVVPSGLWAMESWQQNIIVNIVFVQFAHRVMAHVLVALGIALVVYGWRKTPALRGPLSLVGYIMAGQFLLGIFTLLHAVPVSLGSAHQMGAVALLGAMLNLLYLAPMQQRR